MLGGLGALMEDTNMTQPIDDLLIDAWLRGDFSWGGIVEALA